MKRGPKLIPVSFGDGWGRLAELDARGAVLSTQWRLAVGDGLELTFEAAGERFEAFAARVERCEKDEDGHLLAELRWTDEVHRRRLARALADLLSR